MTPLDAFRRSARRRPPAQAAASDWDEDRPPDRVVAQPGPAEPRAYGEPRLDVDAHPLTPILAEARDRLRGIAATSERASAALRERAGLDAAASGDETGLAPAERGLLEALLERIDAVREETTQLAAVLERTKGGLSTRTGDEREGEARGSLDRLVKAMAGAGLSRKDIAKRVVREHGVVVSERMLDGVAPRPDRAT